MTQQSAWYSISRVFVTQVEALATAQAVGWLDNPALPLDSLSAGQEFLLVVQSGDRLVDQPGQQPERRVLRLIVGAVSLTSAALQRADELHFAARDLIKSQSFRLALGAALPRPQDVIELRESELEKELRDVATQGAVLLGSYEIEYFQAYPSFDL